VRLIDTSSPNFGPRRDGKTPRFIVLHYTDTKDLAETFSYLLNPAREASAHYVVDEDGSVHRLVDESMRAWHAGVSYWKGEEDVNSSSIGIEIQNPGHQYGYRAFPQEQIKSVRELCRDIMARHGIAQENVLGHSDICPGRLEKPDPGHLFPWRELAADGIGIWPRDTGATLTEAEQHAALLALGYDPRVPLSLLQRAFQRRYDPESFTRWDDEPVFGPRAQGRLAGF
jgi:N-acetylmuramoyl-L-alanine amidase